MSVSACHTEVSVLLSLLLANRRVLSCFFLLFLVVLISFLIIPVVREKIRVKLAPAIPTGATTTFTEEIIQTPHLLCLKQFKLYLCNQKQLHVCLIFYCIIFFH